MHCSSKVVAEADDTANSEFQARTNMESERVFFIVGVNGWMTCGEPLDFDAE